MTTDPLETLRTKREAALKGGGTARIETQHSRGKLTARERLAILLDEGSFQEFGALATHQNHDFGMGKERYPGDGVITGFGKINGRRVAVFAQDFTVLGGSFSEVQSQKICRIMDLSMEAGIPLIGLNDSGGARVQEGVKSLAAYGEVVYRNVAAAGVVPQVLFGKLLNVLSGGKFNPLIGAAASARSRWRPASYRRRRARRTSRTSSSCTPWAPTPPARSPASSPVASCWR